MVKKANKVVEKRKSNGIIFITTIVALFIVAAVGFNLEDLSGQAILFGRATISVSPNLINAGEEIEIKVTPGKGCVNRFVGIYDDSNSRKATTQYRGGSNSIVCQPFTATYKTSPSWKPVEGETGIFFVKAFDYAKNDFVKATFTIMGE